MKKYVFPALRIFVLLSILTGVLYPVTMTFLAQAIFPRQANGSMITKNGSVVGSELIGQKFTSDKYFHSRPSAIDENPLPSGGSNFAPTSKAMQDSVHAFRQRFILENNLPVDAAVPKEMLFASASGVDPHISPEAAYMQIERIRIARHLPESDKEKINQVVQRYTEPSQWNLFGQPRVNVLLLNCALDQELP